MIAEEELHWLSFGNCITAGRAYDGENFDLSIIMDHSTSSQFEWRCVFRNYTCQLFIRGGADSEVDAKTKCGSAYRSNIAAWNMVTA